MSKYEIDVWEYADTFKNLDTNEIFYGEQVCELLEQKDQRIAELEEQLKNAIVPKFKMDEDVYIIWHGMIIDVEIKAIGENEYYVDTCHFDLADGYGGIFVNENEIFKTYEEALEELKG